MLGKLKTEDLQKYVLDVIKKRRKEVKCSATVGEDCAFIDLKGKDVMLVTTDPITAATQNIGSLAIVVSSNDIAACGGEPIASFLTIIAPQNTKLEEINQVMLDAEKMAKKLNIEIAGGHTEYSDAVNRLIVSCTMIGFPFKKSIKSTEIKEGQKIIVTGEIASEYTAIQAFDFNNELKSVLSEQELTIAKQFINNLNILPVSKVCSQTQGVVALHDVTEGGLIGALNEILITAQLEAKIERNKLPINDITQKICNHFNCSPLTAISSGSMLIVVEPKYAQNVIENLQKVEVKATEIGEVVSKSKNNSDDKRYVDCFKNLTNIISV